MTRPADGNIAEFEVLDHGEDGSQYFPGCGAGRFESVATGVGDTAEEALDDALESMAQDDARPSKSQEDDMRQNWLSKPSDKSAHDSLDTHDCERDGCDWHHYVSIRYSVRKSDISGISGIRCNQSRYYTEAPWDVGGTFSYRQIDERKDGAWIVPSLASGSDYSGSLVERSNFNVLRDAADSAEHTGPAFWVELYGGYGTFALAFHLERTPEDIREQLLALEDYPLADEDEHSKLEMEAQDAAWDDWAMADYRRALEKEYHGEADDVDGDALFEHFRAAMDLSNTYWENEQGDSMYLDLDRVIASGARKMDPPAGFKPYRDESED